MKEKSLALRARTEAEAEKWVQAVSAAIVKGKPEAVSSSSAGGVTPAAGAAGEEDQDTADWSIDQIITMMETGQVMTAYFSNNTKKNFKLYCKDLNLFACPVNGTIEKAIISLPLRRISDIYVGKQTPGFDTEVAAAVPFDRCFTIISRKYTLDVEAKSYQMATHWLAGIKHLLTKSGKAVIVNEQEAGADGAADGAAPTEEEKHGEAHDSASGSEHKQDADLTKAAEVAAEQAIGVAQTISPDGGHDDGEDYPLDMGDKNKSALIIVDIQNDFCNGGALAVKDANAVISVINKLRKRVSFGVVALTADHHPENHMSFYHNNRDKAGAQLFKELDLGNGKKQMMWPIHCVQKSKGAEFHPELIIEDGDYKIRKGMNADVDSYSGFCDNDGKTKTELAEILHKHGIEDVFVTGLAYDYCVGYTALDAQKEGFNVYVIDDACRGVAEETVKKMKHQLVDAGVKLIYGESIPDSGVLPELIDVIALDEEDEEVDPEHDSGNEQQKAGIPKQLGMDDFVNEPFVVAVAQAGLAGAGGSQDSSKVTAEQVKAALAVEDDGEDDDEPAEEPAPVVAKPDEKKGAATKPATDVKTAPKPAVKPGAKPADGKTAVKPGVKPVVGAKPGVKPGVRSPVAGGIKFHDSTKAPRGAKTTGPAPKPAVKPGAKPGVVVKATTKPVAAKPTVTKPGVKPVAGKPGVAVKPGVKSPATGVKPAVKPPVTGAKPATTGVKSPTTGVKSPTTATKPAVKPAGK